MKARAKHNVFWSIRRPNLFQFFLTFLCIFCISLSINSKEAFATSCFPTPDYFIKNNIKNVYLYPFVFQKFLNKFKKLRFDIIYILFPDPWPKKKHHKRRIVNKHFLSQILKILKINGKVYFSTDNFNYFENVKTILKKFTKIKVKKEKKIVTIKTKYYLKAERKGNTINSLVFSHN